MGVDFKKRSERPFSIIVWGASGYTGGLVAEYLTTNSTVNFAIAAKTKAELEDTALRLVKMADKGRLSEGTVPMLSADVQDKKSLTTLVCQTSVLISASGPYCKQGDSLIAACVENGTDYLDLSEEPYFDRLIIDKFHDRAEEQNVFVISGCGMSSVPSDLGTFLIAEHFHSKKLETKSVRSSTVSAFGGVSGGTVASFCHQFGNLSLRQLLWIRNDPDFLAPGSKKGQSYWGPTVLHYDKDINAWQAPLVWEIINRARVRRSNWLLSTLSSNLEYGHDFQYCESVAMSNFILAAFHSYVLFVAEVLLLFAPVRWILQLVFPPGTGPSREMRKRGNFEIKFVGESESGEKAFATVKGKVDPGYDATCIFVSESALLLASNDRQKTGSSFKTLKGGCLTPSSAMGMSLIDRLKRAGIEFKLSRSLEK